MNTALHGAIMYARKKAYQSFFGVDSLHLRPHGALEMDSTLDPGFQGVKGSGNAGDEPSSNASSQNIRF